MEFGPEPVGEPFDGQNSLEEEHNWGPAEGGPCGCLGKEEDQEQTEEEGACLFDAVGNFEHPDENSILYDVLRYIDHSRSPGN
jgi:hypothetical protein